ncbi:transposase [Paraburkholderia sp. BL23I1N1]|uniref:transposase n=1 Tax=Paraburkholderia sp. BL23I1N1 TaxID=1938802 RepID=UPI00217D70A1|nr:transposase [Paraburkholderia sp. BL23I1N1]
MAVNTVRKYLESGPPQRKARQPVVGKLAPFKAYLQGRVEAAKPDWIPATVLKREIEQRGYTGGLRRVQEYLQKLRSAARPDPVVRFDTEPGHQMQMDWIEFRKVEPMKDAARLIRRHFEGIVAWTQTRHSNGFIEAINGLFQAAKRKARGYARFETMRTVLFLIAGKLDLSRFNEHAR